MKTGRPDQCQCSRSCKRRALPGEAFCTTHIKSCPRQSPLTGWEPNYDPKLWNDHSEITDSHNCFAYAMNVNDPKQIANCKGKRFCNTPFHQPGSAAGYERFQQSRPKTCPNMMARIMGDNPHIRMTTFKAKCPPRTSKIALVVDKSDDYHFLRQDRRKYWSHKPGARPITNLDAGKHKIWDPALCDMNFSNHEGTLNYDIFCGYMCVPRTEPLYLRVGGKRSIRSRGGGGKTRKVRFSSDA
jgi:hypothetical protein